MTLSRRGLLTGVVATAATVPLAACSSPSVPRGVNGQAAVVRYQGWTGKVLFPELAADLGFLDASDT